MATMSISKMREALLTLYDSPSWQFNIKYGWDDRRIAAVYNSCLKYDRFNKKAKQNKITVKHITK